jgi:hypothetical protein
MRHSMNCAGLLLSTLLAACGGGGGDDSGDMMATSAGGASLPERAVILELQQGPPVQVWAGTFFQVTVSVSCAVDAKGDCLETVQVDNLMSAFGSIAQVLYFLGNDVQSFTGQQQGTYFVPKTPIRVVKPGSFAIIVQTGLGDATTGADLRQWSFNTSQSFGQVSVSGKQAVSVLVRSGTVL